MPQLLVPVDDPQMQAILKATKNRPRHRLQAVSKMCSPKRKCERLEAEPAANPDVASPRLWTTHRIRISSLPRIVDVAKYNQKSEEIKKRYFRLCQSSGHHQRAERLRL